MAELTGLVQHPLRYKPWSCPRSTTEHRSWIPSKGRAGVESAGSPSSGSHSHRCGREWILLTCPPTSWTLIARRRRGREGKGAGAAGVGSSDHGQVYHRFAALGMFFPFRSPNSRDALSPMPSAVPTFMSASALCSLVHNLLSTPISFFGLDSHCSRN